jgi:cysteine sulfinate desulfinase/cysteine desulfurase-like protein
MNTKTKVGFIIVYIILADILQELSKGELEYMIQKLVYADNAATTKLAPEALEAMMPYLTEEYGNPSSLYAFGQSAREGIDAARATMAECLGALPTEVYFTSGGSEADNWAIKMAAAAMKKKVGYGPTEKLGVGATIACHLGHEVVGIIIKEPNRK